MKAAHSEPLPLQALWNKPGTGYRRDEISLQRHRRRPALLPCSSAGVPLRRAARLAFQGLAPAVAALLGCVNVTTAARYPRELQPQKAMRQILVLHHFANTAPFDPARLAAHPQISCALLRAAPGAALLHPQLQTASSSPRALDGQPFAWLP